MYHLKRVRKTDIISLLKAADILNKCGKDMALKNNLHHWDNPYLKSILIILLSSWKNIIYLLYDGRQPVATFQIKKDGETLHFEKLGTRPSKSGKGAGSYCMKTIEQLAEKKGCKKVSMEVYELSEHAITFYENKGYNVVGSANTLKYREVIMEKSI